MSQWKLIDAKTSVELNVGDLRLTSSGEEVSITSLQPPHKPESSGKVYVKFIGNDECTAGYYPSVIDAKFIDSDKPVSDWQQRAIAATRGTQTGAILSAALGEGIDAPCFHGKAIVTSDGFVQANFTSKDGRQHHMAFVGSAGDLVRNIIGLARHLNLSDEDKAELFKVVRDWIDQDYSGNALKLLGAA